MCKDETAKNINVVLPILGSLIEKIESNHFEPKQKKLLVQTIINERCVEIFSLRTWIIAIIIYSTPTLFLNTFIQQIRKTSNINLCTFYMLAITYFPSFTEINS